MSITITLIIEIWVRVMGKQRVKDILLMVWKDTGTQTGFGY